VEKSKREVYADDRVSDAAPRDGMIGGELRVGGEVAELRLRPIDHGLEGDSTGRLIWTLLNEWMSE